MVYGYTDIHHNDHIYCAHPFYGNTRSWYDGAYFGWDGFHSLIPPRILMIIDLPHSTIKYHANIDPDELSVVGDNATTLTHLTKAKSVVVKAAKNLLIYLASTSIFISETLFCYL